MEMKCKDDSKIAVSCWLTKAEDTDDCSLCVAVIEPVQRVVSLVTLDESGIILEADETALSLFQCGREVFVGSNLSRWIPSIIWPSSVADLSPVMRSTSEHSLSTCSFLMPCPVEEDSENDWFNGCQAELPPYTATGSSRCGK